MDQLVDVIVEAAASPWVYPVVFVITVLDAFFVIVPSETVVVALGSLALSAGTPNVWILIPVAAAAAVIGDSLTFAMGRALGTDRFRWMRRPRVRAVVDWAAMALDRRAAAVLLTARFVPFGRIAVNLTAGSTGFRYPRFLALTSVAGVVWAGWNVVIGAVFGAILGPLPGGELVAVVVSVIVAVVLGIAVDALSARISARRRARTEPGDTEEDAAWHPLVDDPMLGPDEPTPRTRIVTDQLD